MTLLHISESRVLRLLLEDAKEEVGHARVLLAMGQPDKTEAADLILLGVQHRLRAVLEPTPSGDEPA